MASVNIGCRINMKLLLMLVVIVNVIIADMADNGRVLQFGTNDVDYFSGIPYKKEGRPRGPIRFGKRRAGMPIGPPRFGKRDYLAPVLQRLLSRTYYKDVDDDYL